MPAKAKKASNSKTVTRSSKTSGTRKPYQVVLHAEFDGTATSLADKVDALINDPYGYNNEAQFGRFNYTVKTLTSDELEKVLA